MLNGTKDVTCERHNQDGYGYWTWQDQQPFCQGTIHMITGYIFLNVVIFLWSTI